MNFRNVMNGLADLVDDFILTKAAPVFHSLRRKLVEKLRVPIPKHYGDVEEVFALLERARNSIRQGAIVYLMDDDECFQENAAAHNEILDFFINNPGRLKDLSEKLAEEGFRRVSFKAYKGSMAIILQSVHNQLLRTVLETEPNRPQVDEVLQPTMRFHIDGLRVAVMPEVITKNVTQEHVNHLMASLAKKGYFFWDAKRENVGLIKMEEGSFVPVVIDGGSVISLDSEEQIKVAKCINLRVYRMNEKRMARCLEACNSYPEYDFAGAQAYLLQKHGLETGMVRGVKPDNELIKEQKRMGSGKNNVWTDAFETRRLYTSEVGEEIQNAIRRYEPRKQGFCNYIRESLEYRDFARNPPNRSL